MLKQNNNNLTNLKPSLLQGITTKAKAILNNLMELTTLVTNLLAGYILYDNVNKVIAAAGFFLLLTGTVKLVKLSFKK